MDDVKHPKVNNLRKKIPVLETCNIVTETGTEKELEYKLNDIKTELNMRMSQDWIKAEKKLSLNGAQTELKLSSNWALTELKLS